MKMKVALVSLFILGSSLSFFNCGSSGVGGKNSTKVIDDSIGFNPTQSSNLKVVHYNAHRHRLINLFELDPATSSAIAYLDANRVVFDTIAYSTAYASGVVTVYSIACREVASDSILFPDGISIDFLWKQLTTLEVDEDIKAYEEALLAEVDSQPVDVKAFALCMGASVDAKTVFNNFQTTTSE